MMARWPVGVIGALLLMGSDLMREKDFERQVRAYLKERGCWVLKTWSNGIQREGVPDLLVCCDGWFVGIEVKAESGIPSALQLWNVDAINNANGFAMVLYPSAFDEFKAFIEGLNREEYTRFERTVWK